MQTQEWFDFQKSLGREVSSYAKEGVSAFTVKHDLPFGKSYLYLPRGPELDFNFMTGGFKNPVNNFISWLKEQAKQNKAIFIKAEPLQDSVAQILSDSGFKKSEKEIQPSKTVVLNLKPDKQEILDRMHPKTRYNIKVAQKHNLGVVESDDVESFWRLLKKTVAKDKFRTHGREYYFHLFDFFKKGGEISVSLFLAENDGQPTAGAMILRQGDTGYYLHGASDYRFRNTMAPYMLHWRVIEYLKDKGALNYDLWGIDHQKWPGVSRFKLGWGGRIIEYPGSFDLPISRIWYAAYKTAKLFRK